MPCLRGASFPLGKRRGEVCVNHLHENVMEKRGGDFAAAAAFLDDADADEARIEGGQGGERPGMWRGVFIVFRCPCLAENVHAFDSQ